MSKSVVTEKTPFTLETDDRSDEERSEGKSVKTDRLAMALGGSDKGPAPMDSDYQEELGEAKPKIKFNLNFDKKLRGAEGSKDQNETRKFDVKKLFDAVSSGDVAQLQGLHHYLHRTMKHLTNSEYQPNGKNALLKALLNLRDGRNDTIEFLLDIAEKMGDLQKFVNASYTDSYYKGQTALHVAIERRNSYYVQLLVRKGADVHAKACGKFFQIHDGPYFYFGELPLSLAACTNQLDIVEFLMNNPYQSVCITEADSQGNMVLHALVMVADNTPENTDFVTKMYDEILIMSARLHPKTKLEYIENKEGLTPIKLAAKTGKIGLFKHMMQREFKDKDIKHLSRKFTEWVYGPVHCSLYDLASLDSYETNSVLEIIVYGSEIPNRHEMLQTEPLNRLLEDKWQRFARWIFFFNFIVYVMYVAVFTFTAYYRKEGKPPFPIEHSTEGYLRLSGQLTCVVASVYFFCKAIVDFKRKPPKLQTLLIDGYCEILFFLQAVFYIFSSILYTFGKEEYVGLLVLCLALSWINLLYFSRGSRLMGIYSVMIQKMLLSDIVRFLFVYIVFLFGFSAAVVTLIQEKTNATNVKPVQSPDNPKSRALFATVDDSEGCKKPTYNNFSYTTLELFKFTIGMGDLEFTEDYQFKGVFYVLLITYIVLTYILLLNMLIALMSKTVEKISRESKNIWKLQKAITILDLEKSLPNCLRERLRSGVQKDLSKTAGEDRRWCFRVEEVNWNKWNTDLGIINEDPGNCDGTRTPGPVRGPGWRHTLRAFSRRQPRRQAAHEMDPFPL